MKKNGALYLIAFFIIVTLFFSCSDNDDTVEAACGVDNPIEELPWLKAEIASRESKTTDISKYFYIAQATYNSQTVYVYEDCCPVCNTAVLVYNCKGELLGQVHAEITRKSLKNSKIIYKPDNFACETD